MPMHQARRLVAPPPSCCRRAARSTGGQQSGAGHGARVVPVLEQLSFDEAFGEPVELAGASADDVERFCEELRARCAPTQAWSPRSARVGQADRQDRLGAGQARRDPGRPPRRGGPLSRRCRCASCGGSGRSPRRSCTGWASTPSARLAALTGAEAPTSSARTIGPALHRLAQGIDDRPVAERAGAKQISAESTFAEGPDDTRSVARGTEPSASMPTDGCERDGRGARTVTVKLKKSDMSTLTRSATLPYATTDAATLTGTTRRLLLDPVEIGPIRLIGVGFSGLSDVLQESLFPELGADGRGRPTAREPAGDRRRAKPDRGASAMTSSIGPRPWLGAGRGTRRHDRALRNPGNRTRGGPYPSS